MASKTDRLTDELAANGFPADATLDALADSRCRPVLERLVHEDAPTDLRELTACPSFEPSRTSERAASRLHHVVLPKLDEVGLVTYDWSENVVELDAPRRRVTEYLDRTRQ